MSAKKTPFPAGTKYQLNARVLELIWLERLRQQQLLREGKFTFNCATAGIAPDKKLRVCTEELGEIAKAIDDLETLMSEKPSIRSTAHFLKTLRERKEHLRDEITQLAACCHAWLECLEQELK